jgi:hypothetical protein
MTSGLEHTMKTLLIALLMSLPALAQTQPATIVFYNSPNPTIPFKKGFRMPAYVDSAQVVSLKTNHYCNVQVKPGKHTVRSTSKNRALILDTEPGKAYYVRMEFKHGSLGLSNVWLVTLTDPQQGARDIVGYGKVATVKVAK